MFIHSSERKMNKDQTIIKSQIQQAMRSRLQHFREEADSLTFEGVRRLLEKDLGLDTYALDVHKRHVKQLLEKYLSGTEDDDNVSKGPEQNKLEDVKVEEDERLKEQKVTGDVAKIEDSPQMELSSENELAKSGNSETPGTAENKIPTEDMIKDALWNRAIYFRLKSEELTMASVRRLLEEDLQLNKFSLDSFKKLISKQLDEILNSESEAPNKMGSKSDVDSPHSGSDNLEAEVKQKKKLAPKGKHQKTEEPKKRKRPAQEADRTKKKKFKNPEGTSAEKNNVQESDDESESYAKKSAKKEVVVPEYGKEVERMKSVIKACGMSVAPTIYKKAKQAPEDKREAFLIKELQELLSKEGLPANPSEKDIKEVKRRKERAKELEGIDTSNIVVGSRRKSTFNFVPPLKPKPPIESDAEDSEEENTDNEDSSEDSDNDNEDEDGNVHAEDVHEELCNSD